MSLEELEMLKKSVEEEIKKKQPVLKDYVVMYGDSLKYARRWYCEAKNESHAKTLFRNEFGYNYIKIQYAKEV